MYDGDLGFRQLGQPQSAVEIPSAQDRQRRFALQGVGLLRMPQQELCHAGGIIAPAGSD
jgi:hypothetical protein